MGNWNWRKSAAALLLAGASLPLGSGTASALPGGVSCGCLPKHVVYARDVSDSNNVEIFAMTGGGTDQVRLTNSPGFDGMPVWSPDQSKIAFTTNRHSSAGSLNFELYVMNANGTNQVRLTVHAKTDWEPAWAPDGSRIAFTSTRDGNAEIYTIKPDGTGLTRLTINTIGDVQPAWSPDGSKIAFVSDQFGGRKILIMNADGTNRRLLGGASESDESPAWSADGKTIAFTRTDANFDANVFTVNSNAGSSPNTPAVVRQVTTDAGYDGDPSWAPDGRIVYASSGGGSSSDIRIINADGTGRANLTSHPDWEGTPDRTLKQPALSQG